ncbi:unnamed protein product [Brassica rapa]|uniref:Uncharacterized protein n=1 Tax=Brassica campestris TaxID=3711 RepID=A0A8D9GYG0_BRACM|nr:unnamed protein product [Brassica rapa]
MIHPFSLKQISFLVVEKLWVSSSQEKTSVEIRDFGVCSERS